MSDIGASTWTELDASNTTPAPQGWPEGMAPSGVNNSGRAMMGATKRFWDRINGTLQATNSGNDYSLQYVINDTALYQGSVYTFRAGAANTGAATLNVNDGSGAHPIVKNSDTTTIPLVVNDLVAGGYYSVVWDSLSSHFVILGGMSAATGGSLSNVLTAALRSVSAEVTANITSVAAQAVTSFTAADRSISACITADLRSMSLVLKSDLGSVSAQLQAAINAVSNTISVILTQFVVADSIVRMKQGSTVLTNAEWTTGTRLGIVVSGAFITFTAAFPTTCFNVMAINGDPNVLSVNAGLATETFQQNGFVVIREGATNGSSIRINWIAFGS